MVDLTGECGRGWDCRSATFSHITSTCTVWVRIRGEARGGHGNCRNPRPRTNKFVISPQLLYPAGMRTTKLVVGEVRAPLPTVESNQKLIPAVRANNVRRGRKLRGVLFLTPPAVPRGRNPKSRYRSFVRRSANAPIAPRFPPLPHHVAQ